MDNNINSIKEHMIYGDMIYIDETTEILNEMHFSEKDLQDPKTMDKILKRKEHFESLNQFLIILSIIFNIAISIAIGAFTAVIGGIVVFPIIMLASTKIWEALMAAPNKWYVKESEKFENKVKKLLDKTKEKLEKDPKNKDKYQKIIDSCQKIINIINKKREEAIKKYEEEEHQEELTYYKQVESWLQNPYCFGHTGDGGKFNEWCWCAKFLKVSEKDIIKAIEDHKDKFYKLTIKGTYKDYKGRTIEVNDENEVEGWITLHNHNYNKCVNDLGCHAWLIQSDDDYTIWYTETKKFIESDASTPYKFITPYTFADDSNLPENIEEILIDADKELGYYRLSKCPDNVKKKPWIIK